MGRIALCCATLAIAGLAPAQVWEKWVAPGLTYRMEIEATPLRVIHALRWNPAAGGAYARAALTGKSVYSADVAKSRGTVSAMVEDEGGIAGINADYFPWTGDPLGFMMSSAETLSRPFAKRSCFAWGAGGSYFGAATFTAKVESGTTSFVVDGLNEEAGDDMICLNATPAGYARAKSTGFAVVVQRESGSIGPNGKVQGKVIAAIDAFSMRAVGASELILVAAGTKRDLLQAMKVGDVVSIATSAAPRELLGLTEAVGGGPVLVHNGAIMDAWQAEGFNADFGLKRHPRTAVGRTSDGSIWMVAIDGRQAMTVGATIQEAGQIMARLGCVEAVNLDGGGSTTLNVFGLTMNRPSDGQEREVANGVVLLGPKPPSAAIQLTIAGPDSLTMRETRGYRVSAPDGAALSNGSIFWAASGAAWIDQGGYLRPIKEGKATIAAFAMGRKIERTVEVTKAN